MSEQIHAIPFDEYYPTAIKDFHFRYDVLIPVVDKDDTDAYIYTVSSNAKGIIFVNMVFQKYPDVVAQAQVVVNSATKHVSVHLLYIGDKDQIPGGTVEKLFYRRIHPSIEPLILSKLDSAPLPLAA